LSANKDSVVDIIHYHHFSTLGLQIKVLTPPSILIIGFTRHILYPGDMVRSPINEGEKDHTFSIDLEPCGGGSNINLQYYCQKTSSKF